MQLHRVFLFLPGKYRRLLKFSLYLLFYSDFMMSTRACTLFSSRALYIDARYPPTDLCPFKPTIFPSFQSLSKRSFLVSSVNLKVTFIRERSFLVVVPSKFGLLSISLYKSSAFSLFNLAIASTPPLLIKCFKFKLETNTEKTGGVLNILSFLA